MKFVYNNNIVNHFPMPFVTKTFNRLLKASLKLADFQYNVQFNI